MPLIVGTSAGGSGRARAGALNPGDREGSLSDNRGDGWRHAILFRCEPGRSVVWLDRVPLDFAVGRARVVVPQCPEELAALGPGESFERDITTDRGLSCRVRWTHVG
jgi:hypothetical protein